MQYYDVKRKWSRKVKPHLADPVVLDTLERDFNKFTTGRWQKAFTRDMKPTDFESSDWRLGRSGRQPEYWDYVKASACHWLVNFNLELAMRADPERPWRIVSSQRHSTVWDCEETLFDLQFLAFGVDPNEAFALARARGRVLSPGKHKRLYLAPHFSQD